MKVTTNRRRKGRRTFGATRQLPSGRWQASYLAPDGKRRIAEQTFPEAADANAWLTTIESSIGAGDWRPPEPARETFGAYGKRWIDSGMSRLGQPLSPRTVELYELLWRRWIDPTFGHLALGALTPEAWRTWYVEQTTTHPGSTQPGKAYRLARAILNQAVDDRLLRVNPCRIKGAGKEKSPERPIVTPDEVATIAASIKPEKFRAMVLVAAYCSLRFGELAGLRRKRIDLLHRTINVVEQAVELQSGSVIFKSPKSGSEGTVAIPGELVQILEDHLGQYVDAEPDALVFTSLEGHPLRRTKFRPHWIAACKSAGVQSLHFHDLRGSGATWAGYAGATMSELMARLRQTTPAAAMRYQHATLERDHAIAEKLGALMGSVEAANGSPSEVVQIDRN